MQKRQLGNSNLEVSAIGLGCMGMSFGYGPAADKQEMISLIRSAFERSVTLFDTAEAYGPYTNEELVGEALAPVCDQVVIATKFGSRPEHITDVVESSLKRLKVDTIDLLYQHPSTSMCRSKTSPAWSGICSRQGRSSISGSRSPACRRSGALTPCSPSRRFRANIRCGGDAPKKEVLPTLEELGIGFGPFSPLGKGFLMGAITENTTFDSTDFRNIVPRFTSETRRANQALVELLGEFAARKQVTPAQIAIAWPLAQKPWIVPIPGTTKLRRLQENIGAAAVELTPDDLREIESAVSTVPVQGDRYPERLEQLTGR